MVTVRQSGGDYTGLKAAIDANETTITIDESWTADDTATGTMQIDATFPVTITVSGGASHSGVPHSGGAETHYRMRHTETSSQMFTAADDFTVIGGDFQTSMTGSSDEGIRLHVSDAVLTLTDVMLGFPVRTASHQDCVYITNVNDVYSVNLENCFFYNAYRGGVRFDVYAAGTDCNLNFCSFKGIGKSTQSSQGSGVGVTGSTEAMTFRAFYCIFEMDTGNPFGAQNSGHTLLVDHCLTSSSGWEGDDGNFTETIDDSDVDETFTENASPGAGDFIIVVEKDTAPFDFTLQDNATDNDAQDKGTETDGPGSLTPPATDVVGTTRPQGTNFDAGFFEVIRPPADIAPILAIQNRNRIKAILLM